MNTPLRGTGPTARFARRRVSSIAVAVILLLAILTCVSQIPSARGVTTSSTSNTKTTSTSSIAPNVQGEIAIDNQQFEATVPPYAVLGENYTLRVAIQSSMNMVVPVIIQVIAPVDAIFVHPQVIHMDIQPNGSQVANFTILPFGVPHTGPFQVTALLYVFFPLSMSSPQLVDQVTATVSSIGPNPFPYLEIVLVSASVVTLILIAVFYQDISRRGTAALSR